VLLVVVAVIGLGLLGTEINNLWVEIQTWLGSRGELDNITE